MNKNILVPAVAMIFSASLTSCMADLDKGNINPKAESTPNIMGLYSKCYASFIMEGTDGSADFTIDDGGKSTLVRMYITLMKYQQMKESVGGLMVA